MTSPDDHCRTLNIFPSNNSDGWELKQQRRRGAQSNFPPDNRRKTQGILQEQLGLNNRDMMKLTSQPRSKT